MSDMEYRYIGLFLPVSRCKYKIFDQNLFVMKIIIADDSSHILDRLSNMLAPLEEVNVIGAYNNGKDALEAIQLLEPDIAILDNKMPGINGIDIIKDVRKNNGIMQLILITLHSNDYYRTLALNAGANHFCSKSEDFEKVFDIVIGLQRQYKSIS